jgi:hypothetical protein
VRPRPGRARRRSARARNRRPRSPRQRLASPHSATRQNASTTIAPLILLAPCTRSSNVIGTSATRSPARTARIARSIWKQYPWDWTPSRPIRRRVSAR